MRLQTVSASRGAVEARCKPVLTGADAKGFKVYVSGRVTWHVGGVRVPRWVAVLVATIGRKASSKSLRSGK